MAEEERNRAKAELSKHEEELERAQSEHDAMKAKLIALERKIIVGGENLLEKAEEQVRKCILAFRIGVGHVLWIMLINKPVLLFLMSL